MKKLYDMTQQIYNGMPLWPGHVRTLIRDYGPACMDTSHMDTDISSLLDRY